MKLLTYKGMKKRRLGKRRYYYHMFLFYASLTVMSILTSALIIMYLFSTKLTEEVYRYNDSVLTQIQIYTDTYLIDNVNTLITEEFLDLSQNKYMTDFFLETPPYKTSVVYHAQESMTKDIVHNPFIDSMWVYRKSDDTLLSTREGIIYNMSSTDNYMMDYIDVAGIQRTMTTTDSQTWVSPEENQVYWQEESMISFAQSIPMFAPPDKRMGCVIVNMKESYLKERVLTISDIGESHLYIVSKNQVFGSSHPQESLYTFDYHKDLLHLISGPKGFETLKKDGIGYGVSWVTSPTTDWCYISVTPLHVMNAIVTFMKKTTAIIISIVILLTLIGLFMVTYKIYKPIGQLLTLSNATLEDAQDEFDSINNVITNLSSKVAVMEDTFSKNGNLMEHKLAIDLLYGNIPNQVELMHRLDLIDRAFGGKMYGVIIAQFNPSLMEKLPIQQREFITYHALELLQQATEGYDGCLCINHPSDCVTAIVNMTHKDLNLLHKELSTLLDLIHKDLGITLNITMSGLTDDPLQLQELYRQSHGSLDYSFIYGYQNLLTWEMISHLESNHIHLDIHNLSHLKALLVANKMDSLKKDINHLINSVITDGYSYSSTQNMLLQIISLICRVCREQKFLTSEFDKQALVKEFYDLHSLEDYKGWLFELMDLYDEEAKRRSLTVDHDFVGKIATYIAEHVDEQLSLNSVAQSFNISPSYLSRLFKDGMGMNFSEFIISKRFEKAAQLLVEEKNSKVKDIAERLGYLNLPYFNRLFKERYGMTPLQYRKHHL